MAEKKKPSKKNKKTPPPALEPVKAAETTEDAATDARAATKAGFPIVGIGASAGGLAAFEAFFSAMPDDSDPGMAFVLVQHLAPDHKSILTDLVRRYTRMEVFEVEDGMAVQPNCAYIIPPNRDMAFFNGALQLLEPSAPRGQRLPIDFFFRSLAQDLRERAIGIILSGTGSDGMLGVRAIKGEGGMVMAQNPESTEYDGMPRSAINTGLVDFVLPPAEMPVQLIAYGAHAYGKAVRPAAAVQKKDEDITKKIFILLRGQTGHDFSRYKQNTINRRIERRMAVHQIEGLNEYLRYLQQNSLEVTALFQDLLIGVTSFFRDREAFEVLQKEAVARLFTGKPANAEIRVWVPGCSTGEEAYSIAMLLHEHMQQLKKNFKVQIFATDIDSRAIDVARVGMYPASIVADVGLQRLAQFFTPEPDGGTYRIQKHIRDMLIFSEQDIIKDPPFSRLDLLSCRNLLIYMGADLQKKLIPLFHYSLNPGGMLFLGTSESVGEFGNLFLPMNQKAKLYQRKDEARGAVRPTLGLFLPPLTDGSPAPRPAGKSPVESSVALRELTERALLQQCAPPSALISQRGDLLYLHGRTGRYLEPAPGEAGLNILKMAREGLRLELTTALHKAAARKETVRQAGLRVKTNGNFTFINLTVQPVAADPAIAPEQNLFLVVFEEAPEAELHPAAKGAAPGAGEPVADTDGRIAALQQELRGKEEYLQTTLEEMETSNEELKSTNEEMQSVNEELQSTNEELETSKEELQSVNEELSTVNAELQQKVADLSRANNDMNNLMAGTGIGTIFVNHELLIQRFTPAVTQLINLILTDVGRPVGHIVSNLVGYDRLVEDVRAVLDSLTPREVEVQTTAGAWFLLRIRPYRTLENMIEGAVITFTEITDIKKAQAALQEAQGTIRLTAVVKDARDAILVQALDGRILAWNPSAARIYGWSEAEALAMNISDLIPEAGRQEATAIAQRLARAEVFEPYRMQRLTKNDGIAEIWLTATALVNAAGEVYAIATTERLVT